MSDAKKYIQQLFAGKQIAVPKNRMVLLDEFAQEEKVMAAIKQILDNQKMLVENWIQKNRIEEVKQQHVTIPNGTVGKAYEAKIDKEQLVWSDVMIVGLTGIENAGLQYDNESLAIKGIPVESGDITCTLFFKITGEEEGILPHEKTIPVIINPNPKTLWKNIESDKEDKYWKEDDVAVSGALGNKHIVIASKRGRSHANVGSFRDDDFAYRHFTETGWNLIVVADGAGSAKFARQGSRIACQSVVDYFSNNLATDTDKEFETILLNKVKNSTEESQKKISQFVYHLLSKAAFYVHQQLGEASVKAEAELKDFHTTLIFTLFKKFAAGYAFLSFGVGDSPIALLNKNGTEVTLMNGLDVGEFGGGTRFITMPDIFKSDAFSSRFKFKLVDDFSYLVMMTDGVYDAKFVVEANLEKAGNWKVFLQDLGGENEDKIAMQFNEANTEIASQLSQWMDFWSAGNHDDRTLAIVF